MQGIMHPVAPTPIGCFNIPSFESQKKKYIYICIYIYVYLISTRPSAKKSSQRNPLVTSLIGVFFAGTKFYVREAHN